MSLKIHHGAPGSYKTSGAVWDDFIPAVFAGRHVVTNVRGLDSRERVIQVLSEVRKYKNKPVPDTFKLTHVDTTDSEKMEMLRRWFHWAPDGAFFLLDEIQEIYPKSIRADKFTQFDYPNGLDAATAAGRLPTLALAFEKHRHHNWDFSVTTPNISLIHPTVRAIAETAFKHRNNATIGAVLKGTFNEGFHMADTSGKKADLFSLRRRRIPKYVFKLYQSTATGSVTDTLAGLSIFTNPRLLFGLGVLALSLTYVFSQEKPEILKLQDTEYREAKLNSDKNIQTVNAPVQTSGLTPVSASNQISSSVSPPVGVSMGSKVPTNDPEWLRDLKTAEKVYVNSLYYFKKIPYYNVMVESKRGYYVYSQDEIAVLGAKIKIVNKCLFLLTFKDFNMTLTCPPIEPVPEQEKPLKVANPFG